MALRTRRTLQAGVLGLGLGLGLLVAGAPVRAATLTIACGSNGQDHASCKQNTQEWAQKTGHTVKLYTSPSSTTDLLGVFRKMFAAPQDLGGPGLGGPKNPKG